MVNNIFRILFQNTIFVSCVILIILFAYPLFKRWYVPRLWCLIWLLLAIRLIFPIENALLKLPVSIDISSDYIYLENYDFVDEIIVLSNEESSRNFSYINLSIYDVVTTIWIAGIILYAIYYLIKYYNFKKTLKNTSYIIHNKEIQDLFRDVLMKTNINQKRNIGIKGCSVISTPMLIGIVNPTLLMPNKDYDNDQIRMIMMHELTHFYNRDLLLKYILLIAKILHWFNPMVHIMTLIANNDIELSCDYKVVKDKDLEFRKLYSDLIISHINLAPKNMEIISTNFYCNKRNIKNRLAEVFDFKEKKKGNYILVLTVVAIMIISPNVIEGKISYNGNLDLIKRGEQYQIELLNELFTSFNIDSNNYNMIQYDDKPLYNEITMLVRVDDPIPSSSYGDTKLYYFLDDNGLEGLAMKQDINGINYLYRFKADESSRSGWKITDRKEVIGQAIFMDDYFINNPVPKSIEKPVSEEN